MKPSEFTKRWVDGMKNLSPVAQTKGLIAGNYGNIIGFLGGIFTMGYLVVAVKQYQWWWTLLILIVALFVTLIDLVARKQQLKSLLEMEQQIKLLENVKL